MSKNTPNLQQLEAINHVYGPMRVLAGPGTGKTELLALRIAELLKGDAQVQAHEILCITFTDAGRIAMRTRLSARVGPETANKIAIHTYHSFCNEIIQNNLKHFDKDNLEQASDLEKIQIVKSVIDGLPIEHILRNPKKPYDFVKSLSGLFADIKQENLQVDEIIKKIEEHIEVELPKDESLFYKRKTGNFNVGDPKADFHDAVARFTKTKAAVLLFDIYKQTMLDNSRYDYTDMIQWVITMFENNYDILCNYAERFQYILVDEYQDTNGSQNKLIELLCSVTDSPNLFVVGDDDQSIYRFQGASKENMRMIELKYESELKNVQLEHNYRSTQEILDCAENFIGQNASRIKQDFKGLVAHKGYSKIEPNLVGLQNPRQEYIYLANSIKALLDKGIQPFEIAVLFTKNAQCLTLGKYLKHAGIAFHARSKENLLQQAMSKKLLKIMQYLALENDVPFSGDGLLFEILHYYFFDIPSFEIAKASAAADKNKDSKRRSLREYLSQLAMQTPASLFKEEPIQKLIAAINLLNTLIKDSNNNGVYITFKTLVQKCNLHAYIIRKDEKLDLLDELTALFEFIETEALLQPEMTVSEFINLLDLMQSNDIPVDYYKTFGKDNGVQLLTLHSSKGLEFEHVFLASVMAENWEGKKNMGSRLPLPPTVLSTIETNKNGGDTKDDDTNEMRRLLYVGITRAKQNLNFSYFRTDNKGKEKAPSQFLLEIFKDEKALVYAAAKINISEDEMAFFEPVDRIVDAEINIKELEKDFVENQLKNFTMSVSALNNYLECQLKFYFNNILRVPSGINENASFGSAIHKAYEVLFKNMQENKHQNFENVEFFVAAFEKEMFIRRKNFTKDGYNEKIIYGKSILEKNYNTFINTWNKIVSIEWQPLPKPEWQGITLTGFMDKIEFNGKNCNIIDYKTGDITKDYTLKNLKAPNPKKPDDTGGNYWRQAVFYKILVDNCSTIDWQTDSAEFVFVEPIKDTQEIQTHKIHVSPQDEAIVYEQIKETHAQIMDHNFYKGCGDTKCNWCNFVQENNLNETINNADISLQK
jgi:DNA helicase II / ATP-dependent DNA helicase PcrA